MPFSTLLLCVLAVGISYLSFIKPAYATRHYTSPQWARNPPPDEVKSLKFLLGFELGRESYRQFLEERGNEGNLLFWEQIELFREVAMKQRDDVELNEDLTDAVERETKAEIMLIDDFFLRYDANVRIEIKDLKVVEEYSLALERCGEEVRLALGGPLPLNQAIHIFDPLQYDVFKQMNRYWDLYYSSDHYRILRKKLKEHESIRKLMLATDVVGFGDVTEVTVGFGGAEATSRSDFFESYGSNQGGQAEPQNREPLQLHFRKNIETELPKNPTHMASVMLGSSYLPKRRMY